MKYLKEIAEIITGYTFREAVGHDPDGGTKVLTARNILDDGMIEYDGLQQISMDNARSGAFVREGDILLTSRGVFRAAVYRKTTKNTLAASSVFILRLKNGTILPEYLSVYLNSKSGQGDLQKITSGATIKTMLRGALENLPIPTPPKSKQDQIVRIDSNWKKREKLLLRKIHLSKNVVEGSIQYLLKP